MKTIFFYLLIKIKIFLSLKPERTRKNIYTSSLPVMAMWARGIMMERTPMPPSLTLISGQKFGREIMVMVQTRNTVW